MSQAKRAKTEGKPSDLKHIENFVLLVLRPLSTFPPSLDTQSINKTMKWAQVSQSIAMKWASTSTREAQLREHLTKIQSQIQAPSPILLPLTISKVCHSKRLALAIMMNAGRFVSADALGTLLDGYARLDYEEAEERHDQGVKYSTFAMDAAEYVSREAVDSILSDLCERLHGPRVQTTIPTLVWHSLVRYCTSQETSAEIVLKSKLESLVGDDDSIHSIEFVSMLAVVDYSDRKRRKKNDEQYQVASKLQNDVLIPWIISKYGKKGDGLPPLWRISPLILIKLADKYFSVLRACLSDCIECWYSSACDGPVDGVDAAKADLTALVGDGSSERVRVLSCEAMVSLAKRMSDEFHFAEAAIVKGIVDL